ncbi:DUF6801 domain-containing protein [Amycolatopsis vancoresmycina]|uniref:DUF6801 domain-containing protein n=1 Tax=Amycolatopsis vancoresmycina DSM 44592 TaxID=1292037 RepID=R1HPL6_9PSEU|nr:DUF6801 domain-containing protein [Amycolatopsis vancoresmycina]EOD65445.1 hypothetical protein H480_26597 [Amycolatopsis vancoresmycina DSM 44592]
MRIARSLLAACVLALAFATPAAASTPIDEQLGFTCPFPLIGLQKLDVEIKASFEVPSAPGGTFTTADLAVAVTVPDKSARGLALVGAASIEGTASAGVTLANGPLTLPLALPLTVAKTAVPPSGAFTTNASGSVPPVRLPNAGKTTLTIGGFSTRLTPKKADGSYTGLGSFTSDCTLDPGQDPVLLSFDLGAARDYGVTGSTTVKALGASAPLTGSFAGFSPGFDRTRAEFKVFGFVPGTADLQFGPDGPQTGEITGDGFVAHAKLALALPQVTLFGLPVADAGCRASAPIPVDLKTGPGFALASGGPVSGQYTVPALTGCGTFTPYLSSLVQGDGNTFALTLTAR